MKASRLSKTPQTSNHGAVMAAHIAELAKARHQVQQADAHQKGYRKALYEALAITFELTRKLRANDQLKEFAQGESFAWGSVADANPFQPMVALSFKASPAESTSLSKYAKLLAYADEVKPADVSLPVWIKANGGIEVVVAMARAVSKPISDDTFDETEAEHVERAVNSLSTRRIGEPTSFVPPPATSAIPPNDIVSADLSYRRALVRLVDGKIELVDIVPSSSDEIKSDLRRVVPPEPVFSGPKLRAQPNYLFFRMADIFCRFPLLTKAIVEDLKPQDEYLYNLLAEGEIDMEAWAAKLSSQAKLSSKEKKQLKHVKSGLRFAYENGQWQASVVNTLAAFPGLVFDIAEPPAFFETKGEYFLAAHQLRRFSDDFRKLPSTSLRQRVVGTDHYDAAAPGELVVDLFDAKSAAWRTVAKPTKLVGHLEISKTQLSTLALWQSHYAAVGADIDKQSFPKLFQLAVAVPDLLLTFPGPVASTPAISSSQQRVLASVAGEVPEDFTLVERWLGRNDMLTLAGLATDYGMAFTGQFAIGNEGAIALVLRTDGIEVTLPLLVSLAQDYAGMTRAV